MAYSIAHEHFSGPLELLLSLIERDELDVTKISLAKVTDDYLKYLNANDKISPEEMADFLLIAAKLIVIKSNVLLPGLDIQSEPENLADQLKLYQEYVTAMHGLEAMLKQNNFSYSREKMPLDLMPSFNPPANLTGHVLAQYFVGVINRLEPIISLPAKMIKKVIRLEERIASIRDYVKQKIQTSFRQLMGHGDKTETIVNFLALLELMKQRTVVLEQTDLFSDINIRHLD